jgi:hypothetical protein
VTVDDVVSWALAVAGSASDASASWTATTSGVRSGVTRCMDITSFLLEKNESVM